jgi:hypothetical protein
MDTLNKILKHYKIDYFQGLPIKLPISRFVDFPALLRKLGMNVGVEIGVQKGRYSRVLCMKNPNLKLYCVDPWTAYPEYVEQNTPEEQPLLDEFLQCAKERLAPYNVEFVQKYSMDAVNDFEDESLDFVFIDGNHTFEYVVEDIAQWEKKVKVGGIVAGHDYWNSIDGRAWAGDTDLERMKLCQVKDAVDSWTLTNRIKPWFIMTGDRCNSWFYVKENYDN